MADVFISYAHADEEIAAAVARGLEARGYTTWRYQEKSRLGGSYLKRIGVEIRQCRAALFVVSAASLASPQCEAELVRAHELAKPLLPLRRGISHAELVNASDEWGMALKAAVTAEVTPETALAMADIAAGVLREQGIEPGEPPALPTSPLRRLSRGAVHGIAPKDAPLGALVAAVVGGIGLPSNFNFLGHVMSPPAGTEAWVFSTFPVYRSATGLVNLAGIVQNALLLYGAWLVYRREERGRPLLARVSLSMLVTIGLWLLAALVTFSGSKRPSIPRFPGSEFVRGAFPDSSSLVSGAISMALMAGVPTALVFALFRKHLRPPS